MEIDCIEEVKGWIEKFVIGLNLCPFAKAPFAANKISYKVQPILNTEDFLLKLVQELRLLLDSLDETAIIIIPSASLSFRDYLDLFDECETLLMQINLEEEFQLASFHPNYQFADTNLDDQSNYTNRSPYPLIHILRVESMSKAINSYGDTSEIYKRNIELLNSISKEELEAYTK